MRETAEKRRRRSYIHFLKSSHAESYREKQMQGDTYCRILVILLCCHCRHKGGMAGKNDIGLRPAVDVINLGQGNVDPMMAISLEPPMHDEL
ncbi:hypothetical protein RHMOL_Rhmol09G0027200 [Rhododendron molle]|uniref:Uncharacterized protein n=1 Tax=Rhododendron molle TaxID=49168 RepID=A0ACC0M951_RHOML|nr:hypothetical protein RHMOL_Rhmol09G0027200 [Rhododendron molle]